MELTVKWFTTKLSNKRVKLCNKICMQMKKKTFISTPIYYASGDPHIGHAYTTLLADYISRYKRLLGKDVFFSTGMDEFGQKIENLAKKNNIDPQKFVDENFKKFSHLFEKLGISYTMFVRTTNHQHIKTIKQIFKQMESNGDIYFGQWKGFYCLNCEENYTLSQIKKDENGKMFCAVGHEIIEKNTESYFFNIKKHEKWINQYLNDNKNLIVPSHRLNELKNNFLNNLTDLSISRNQTSWGIDVPENNEHKIYVWLDALFNYLTILGYGSDNDKNYQEFWNNDNCERIHLMSKEITRFHCIYWPIFLHSLNLKLPTKILAHGWIVTKEGKMSKSLGNVVDPFALLNKYGRDSVRYFFAKEISPFRDGVFSNELFIETINSDLANNIGNLVNRTIGMLNKYTNGFIPKYIGIINPIDNDIENEINNIIDNLENHLNNFEINIIIENTIKLVKIANKYIEDYKPWELYKNNEQNKLNSLLTHLCLIIRLVVVVLGPILIDGTKNMATQMNFTDDIINLKNCKNFKGLDNIKVNQASPIYQRFENDEKDS